MKIHEYQGKQILKKFGVTVPRGIHCTTVDDAVKAAETLGGKVWVVKAQIHAGGRGKGGGVKVATSLEKVREYASQILGMQLITHQTGPEGQKVRHLLIEEGADIKHEYYVAALTDRATQSVAIMASYEGGMDIEEVAHKTPEKIVKVFVNPLVGLTDEQALTLAKGMGMNEASIPQCVDTLKKLYTCYMETDASLAEINPLIHEGDGTVKALDAKFNFDSNALYRQPEIVAMRDLDEEDADEIEASKFDLAYISLDGNIGCLVNGAGLAMATMDTIKLFGAEPADVEEVGRLGAEQLDGVHGGHGQTGTVHQTADVAVQGDVGQVELGGFDFVGIFFIQIAVFNDFGMTEEGVGVEIELGVQSLDVAVAFQDQRVDFRQGGIGFHVALVQLLDLGLGLGHGVGGNADALGQVQGLLVGDADQGINEFLEDLLGGGVGHFLDVHTAFGGGHDGDLLGSAVGQDSQVVFLLDVGAFFNQQAADLLAFRAGLVGHQLHAQNLGGVLAHFIQGLGNLHATALAAATSVNLGLHDPHLAAQFLGDLDSFVDGEGRLAARRRHAELSQDLLTLIFMNFHALSLLG